jgi:DNA repair protein RecN (Recombination protein N)
VLHELAVENLLLIERPSCAWRRASTCSRARRARARPCWRTRSTSCSAAGARRTSSGRAPPRPTSRGFFDLPEALRAALAERLPEDAEELVLARRVSAEGRTRAYLGGRSVPVGELREVAANLIAFYGQHEHRRLMLASAQLELLDGACGPEHLTARAAFAAAWARAREVAGSLDGLRELAGARDRELDLLDFELAEIEELAPSEAEQAELLTRRERLRHAEALRGAAWGGAEALAPEDGAGVTAGLSAAGRRSRAWRASIRRSTSSWSAGARWP